ncbi:hypothetical protein RUND412_008964 [Rhizina undulata]
MSGLPHEIAVQKQKRKAGWKPDFTAEEAEATSVDVSGDGKRKGMVEKRRSVFSGLSPKILGNTPTPEISELGITRVDAAVKSPSNHQKTTAGANEAPTSDSAVNEAGKISATEFGPARSSNSPLPERDNLPHDHSLSLDNVRGAHELVYSKAMALIEVGVKAIVILHAIRALGDAVAADFNKKSNIPAAFPMRFFFSAEIVGNAPKKDLLIFWTSEIDDKKVEVFRSVRQ